MKAKIILTYILLSYINANSQNNSCQQKFLNCKEMIINSFKNNDTSYTAKLSDELYQMQLCDSSLGKKFTSWYSNFIENYKSEIDNEIEQLKLEKENIQETANQVRTQSLNNTNQFNQQIIQKTKNQNTQKNTQKSTPYKCDECPAGTVR